MFLLIFQAEITAEVEKICDFMGSYKAQVCLTYVLASYYRQ